MGGLRLAINSKMLCGGGKTYGSVSKGFFNTLKQQARHPKWMPGLLLGGIRSKAILQLKTGQAVSEQVDQPQRHQGHETSGNEQSQRDGRQSVAQADVQKGRNQSPGPGSGPRQGDGHEQH